MIGKRQILGAVAALALLSTGFIAGRTSETSTATAQSRGLYADACIYRVSTDYDSNGMFYRLSAIVWNYDGSFIPSSTVRRAVGSFDCEVR